MATGNLSEYDSSLVADAAGMKFWIVVSEWNPDVTGALLRGAYDTLMLHGAKAENISVGYVPGSFELIFASRQIIKNSDVDAVIALGCVVRGGTPHFEYVCQGTTYGIARLNAEYDIPVIFGLLTAGNMEQAIERAGGIHGNKGTEAAITAIKMVDFYRNINK